MQNQLMIAGGYRGDFYLQTYGGTLMGKILMDAVFSLIFISRPSYLFDEDTGESKRIPNMMFIDYMRPQMILVDHDFCQ